MKLRKQIQMIFNNDTVNQNRVDRVEKIADDYAIGFAEWCNSEDGINYLKDLILIGELSKNPSLKELLEIYKQTL